MLLTIHMDPIDTKSPIVIELKEKTRQILCGLDKRLTFHDFRIVRGETHTNIMFDVVVPFDLKPTNDEIYNYIDRELKKINPYYFLVLKVDYDYVGNN